MAAIYAVYTSPNHPSIPNHLPTLIVTPHGQPTNILYSYLHTNFNSENYLLTPSPQGDLCVAKLFPPRPAGNGKASASDPGHSSSSGSRVVRCEASRNLKWSIANTGVISPIYKLSLPSPDSPDLPLFQVSKPNPNAAFWSMFYFAYAGHNIPPKRVEFGKIQKNPPGPSGGGTRISITGKTPEEKAVWQTLGEGNEDCVEWVVLCAALNLLDDEIIKAAEKNPVPPQAQAAPGARPSPVSLRDPGPASAAPPPGQGSRQQPIRANTQPVPMQQQQQQQQRPMQQMPGGPGQPRPMQGPGPGQQRPMQGPGPGQQRPPMQGQGPPGGMPQQRPPGQGMPGPAPGMRPPAGYNGPPPQGFNGPPPPQGFNGPPPPQGFNGPPPQGFNGPPPQGFNGPSPQGFNGPPPGQGRPPPQGYNGPPGQGPPGNFAPNPNQRPPPTQMQIQQMQQQQQQQQMHMQQQQQQQQRPPPSGRF